MELFRALGAVCESPGAEIERIAAALELAPLPSESDFADLFTFQLYPYASVYVGAEGMLGGEARDRVAGFWRALRLPVPAEPDHLAALLGLYATLAGDEQAEIDEARTLLRRRSRQALLWEHLLSWLPPFLAKVEGIGAPPYARWAALLREALAGEVRELGPPESLPLHLRLASELELDSETGTAELVAGLLAPVRSGMILVRGDLHRAASELGLGLRAGERRFALAALLQQEPAAVLRWLAAEARAWSARHVADAGLTGIVAAFWASRAEAAAKLLEDAAVAAASLSGRGS